MRPGEGEQTMRSGWMASTSTPKKSNRQETHRNAAAAVEWHCVCARKKRIWFFHSNCADPRSFWNDLWCEATIVSDIRLLDLKLHAQYSTVRNIFHLWQAATNRDRNNITSIIIRPALRAQASNVTFAVHRAYYYMRPYTITIVLVQLFALLSSPLSLTAAMLEIFRVAFLSHFPPISFRFARLIFFSAMQFHLFLVLTSADLLILSSATFPSDYSPSRTSLSRATLAQPATYSPPHPTLLASIAT